MTLSNSLYGGFIPHYEFAYLSSNRINMHESEIIKIISRVAQINMRHALYIGFNPRVYVLLRICPVTLYLLSVNTRIHSCWHHIHRGVLDVCIGGLIY